MKKISVLIVDDSSLIRDLFSTILSDTPDIHVIGTACDPYDAREKIKKLNPDVLTLDIEMPKMDGISFLEKIMALRPMPVIMASSLTQKGAEATLRAFEAGAFDVIGKPASIHTPHLLQQLKDELTGKVRSAARANAHSLAASHHKPARLSAPPIGNISQTLIAMGASTGGVEALRDIFLQLPSMLPPIVIAQHMPEHFTHSFAARLNSIADIQVKEAESHDRLKPGHAYLAPGGKHLTIHRIAQEYVCKLEDGPPVSSHKPSVDVLFQSVAKAAGAHAIGVILTGMGKDGAAGLKHMRDCGAYTIGQNQATCVVYGMPQVAARLGAIQTELALRDIPKHLLTLCQKERATA